MTQVAAFTGASRLDHRLRIGAGWYGKKLSSIRKGPESDGTARVKTYRDVFYAYGNHPEPKSLAPETDECEATNEDS